MAPSLFIVKSALDRATGPRRAGGRACAVGLLAALLLPAACAKGIVADPWDPQMRTAARAATPARDGKGAERSAPAVRASLLLAKAGDAEPMNDSSGPEARVMALPSRQSEAVELQRATLNAAIAAGPQRFMSKVILDPFFMEGRFVGFSLTRFYEGDPRFASVDLRRGDVIMRVNGMPIGRPHQFMRAWDDLRRANEIKVEYLRGAEKRVLRVRVTGDGAKLGAAPGRGPIDE